MAACEFHVSEGLARRIPAAQAIDDDGRDVPIPLLRLERARVDAVVAFDNFIERHCRLLERGSLHPTPSSTGRTLESSSEGVTYG
jgi:hypothetical protein